MRFAQVHKFAAYTLAVLGLVALGAGGELQGPSTVVFGLAVVASWFAEGDLLLSERYTRTWNVAIVLALATEIARAAFSSTQVLTATVEFAALLQLLKLANRRTARDYQQITVLALLHLIAATVLGGGLSYAICFVGFVIATPWAMTLGHLRREIEGNYLADARAGRAGVPIDVARILRSRRVVGAGLLVGSSLLAVPIFLLTAMIFVLFPRIGLGVLTLRPHAETAVSGFGSSVDLQGHGMIRNDPTIVLRIEPLQPEANPAPVRSFRLRGTTFDTYNGHGWERRRVGPDVTGIEHTEAIYPLAHQLDSHVRAPDPLHDEGYRIVLDPLDPPVVLLPEGTLGLRIDPRLDAGFPHYMELTYDRGDGVRYVGNEDLGLVYTAYVPPGGGSSFPAQYVRPEDLERYLERYRDAHQVSPRVAALARRIAGPPGTPDLVMAQAIQTYLWTFRYTLNLESGGSAAPLDDFLLRTRAGHCEYFSTAMAMMLRAVGVPTRNVTGFLGGAYNRYGHFYAIHQGDAHSWVEVYDVAHRRWLTYDPTPPAGEMPLIQHGFGAEVDAVIEAARQRWRSYVVDYDLNTQARMAMRLWRYIERHRNQDPLSPRRIRHRGLQAAASARKLPWRPIAGGVVVALVGAAAWFQWRRKASAEAQRTAPRMAVRQAQELARVLDAALAARGHVRPSNRSPLNFARELARRGDPVGPLAERVARRYVEARFGDVPLHAGELEALRTELREVTAPPP